MCNDTLTAGSRPALEYRCEATDLDLGFHRGRSHNMYGLRFMVASLLIGSIIGVVAWYVVMLVRGALLHVWFI